MLAVIPAQLRLSSTGITVFENSLESPDIADWHLEKVALDAATSAISSRYQILRAEAASQPVEPPDGMSEVKAMARNLVPAGQSDLIVVISLEPYRDAYDYYPQSPRDIGIHKQKLPIGGQAPFAHAYTHVTILDGKTFDVVSNSIAFMPPGTTPVDQDNMAAADLPAAVWHDHWSDWPPAQKAAARERITMLLSTSIHFTAQKMVGGS